MTIQSSEVLVYQNDTNERLAQHQIGRISDLANLTAKIKGYAYGGWYSPDRPIPNKVFFIPGKTLLKSDAAKLGIHDESDFYGGMVAQPYMLTKSIVHELVDPGADQPEGWKPAFGKAMLELTLPGYTVFSKRDAITAVKRLLSEGHVVRAKRAAAAGGLDHFVVNSPIDLGKVWTRVTEDELTKLGLVLEANMQPGFKIYAAGQMRLGGVMASFAGTVREFPNAGLQYFGGTDITIVRGDFKDLLSWLPQGSNIARSTEKIRDFHNAARQHLDVITSRAAYTTLLGAANNGHKYHSVLEQSWRIGGSSGPEILAMQAFKDDGALQAVKGMARNIVGTDTSVPEGARIHYRGDDTAYGSVTVYSAIEALERKSEH